MDPRTLRAKQEYEGKHFYTKDGEEEFVITNLNSVADVTVQFVNSGLIKHTNIGNIKCFSISPNFAIIPKNVLSYVALASTKPPVGSQPKFTAKILIQIAAKKYVGSDKPIIVNTVTV